VTPGAGEHSLGVPVGKVRLAVHDPAWASAFTIERNRLSKALADMHPRIEHIGSTSIPGIVAKPLLDIMVGIPDMAEHPRAVEPLVALGYEHKGEFGIPGRQFFVLGDAAHSTHHLHLEQYGGHFWRLNLVFRDHLRTSADARDRYAAEKRRLVAEFREEREKYTAGKDAIIRELLREAGWEE
jgi:GrpB-like predicted nucleotidyltransferase (UPF0157 family)